MQPCEPLRNIFELMVVELSESELRRDLYQLNLTQKEVAEKHECSRMTVSRRMREYGLENLPSLRVQRKRTGRTYYASGNKEFAEHQLVAIAGGADPHDAFDGAHIHHINGCPHDNRPENMALLTPQEHGLVEHSSLEVDYENEIIYKPLELS